MEYPVVKIDFRELDEIDFEKTNPAIYNIWWDGQLFEILVNYKKEQERAVVIGGGFVNREVYKLPLFSRHSWAGEIGVTCIFYFDSTMRLTDKAGLLWCYGNNDDWYLERVAIVLLRILDNLGIRISDTLFYGSSGGGFTAACLATLLGGKASVINPQWIVTNYLEKVVQEFKRVSLREGEELIPERIDIVKLFQREGYRPQLHYIQNTTAEKDYEKQRLPFQEELKEAGIQTDFLKITEYSAEGGHTEMPPREDSIRMIHEDLEAPFTPPENGTPFLRRIRGAMPVMSSQEFRQRLSSCYFHKPKMYFNDQDVCGVADEIMSGNLRVYGNLPAMSYVLEDLDWNIQFSAHPRTFQLYLQSLTAVGTLTRAYELSSKKEYLSYAEALIRNWQRYASDREQRESLYLWVDHSAALRVEYLIYFGRIALKAGYGDEALFELLQSLLELHGTWLYECREYAAEHNHGVIHDGALLYVGTLFRKKGWITMAKRRLEKQERWAFAEDHVHKENSVTYAVMVTNLFEAIGSFLQRNEDPFGDKLTNDMCQMQEYIHWATKPNGIIAQIGDTQNFPGKKYGTALQMRRKTKDIHRIFPISGVYFYRSNTDEDVSNDTWKTFKSGYVRTTHKHADDGSFILYSKGYEIFVDCGVYGTTVNDYRKYFLSAMAHNCVVADGSSWIPNVKNMDRVGVVGYAFKPGCDYVRAFNNAYPGIQMERLFCSADDLTVIADSMCAEEPHRYTQLFHLGEDMQVLEADEKAVRIRIGDSGYVACLRQHGDPAVLIVYRGDLGKPGYGLISRGTNHLDVITTLAFDMTARNGRFITSITIEDEDGNIRLFGKKESAALLRYNEKERRFDLGSSQIFCDLPERELIVNDGIRERRVMSGAGTDAAKELSSKRLRSAVAHVEQRVDGNDLTIRLQLAPEWEGKLSFAWYLNSVREHKTLIRDPYGPDAAHRFTGLKPGEYQVKYFLKDSIGRESFCAEPVTVKGDWVSEGQEAAGLKNDL